MCPEARGRSGHLAVGQTHALVRQPVSGNLLFSFTKRRGSAASEGSFPQEFPHFPCRECGDRGARPGCAPAHLFPYLPALTPLSVAREGDRRCGGRAAVTMEPLGAPGAVVDTLSRVLWGHHPGRRADCRLSVSLSATQNRKEEGNRYGPWRCLLSWEKPFVIFGACAHR